MNRERDMTDALLTSRPGTVSVDQKLASLLEDAAKQLQRGESVDLTKLALDHPSHADALRDLLPTIAAMVGISHKSTDESASLSGTLGKYQLMAKLGEGGMGTVYMAMHTELQKTVALKVLPAHRMNDSNAVARFRREIKAAGRFDHANIVRASDAGEEQGKHFLVMEFIDGCDLSRLVRRLGPLPIADACQIIKLAAEGLDFAHRHGLVHRDVKPSNIMLTPQGQIKILDLGLALLDDRHHAEQAELTNSGQMIGTIDYMAPEQGSDSHAVDARVDVYSLGATLYQLLSGKAPFAGAEFDTLLKKMNALASRPAPPIDELRADVPRQLATIVARMLAKNPADRFGAAAEVAAALGPYTQGSDLAALLRQSSAVPQQQPIDTWAISTSNRCDSGTTHSVIDADAPVSQPRTMSQSPPSRRWSWPLVAAALLGPLVVAGVILIVRDKDGKEKIRIALDKNDKVEIVQENADNRQAAATPADNGNAAKSSQPVRLFAPRYAKESTEALVQLLGPVHKSTEVVLLKSLADISAKTPGVLVIAMDGKAFQDIGAYHPEVLKQQKVVGIGYGAAKLFGELGLAINGGAAPRGSGCAADCSRKKQVVAAPAFESPLFVFDPPVLDTTDSHSELFFGMYVGDKHPKHADVEIIALQTADKNYAPIVRQGAHVLVCVDAPADKWSKEFRRLIQSVAVGLDSRLASESTGVQSLQEEGNLPMKKSNSQNTSRSVPNSDFAVYLGCGHTGSPGAIHQVNSAGKTTGTILLSDPPNGLAVRDDSLVVAYATPTVGGGQMLVVQSDGQLDRLPLKKQFPAPIAMALDYNAKDLLIADNEEHKVYRVSGPDNEIKLLFPAPLDADQDHLPSMFVAATADRHILFSASDPKGVYRVSAKDDKLPERLLKDDAGLAAQPGTNRWVAMTRDELRVFDGANEQPAIPCPPGSKFWHYRVLAFAPDGRLFVVLETGIGLEVRSLSLDEKKFTSRFVWKGQQIESMAVGPAMAWKDGGKEN